MCGALVQSVLQWGRGREVPLVMSDGCRGRLLYASRLLSGEQSMERLRKLEHGWRLQLVEMALERHNHPAAVTHLGRLEKQVAQPPAGAAL